MHIGKMGDNEAEMSFNTLGVTKTGKFVEGLLDAWQA
jgi:hypothetical protein